MKKKLTYILSMVMLLASSCGEDFLEYPSTTQPTVDNYYSTAEEVYGATGILYNTVWDRWSDKAFISVGDVLAGTVTGMVGNPQYNSFHNFNIQSTDGLVWETWYSCYKAAGNAGALIEALELKKSQIGEQDFLTIGIAEARFIRGFAYFYIARTFGDAPIVDNPLSVTQPGGNLVPRYHQEDVLRYALQEFEAAEEALPIEPAQPGRVFRYSATGMMAKVYLYMKDYANAAAKAREVIDYAEATANVGLHADYMELFTSSSVARGNPESLFALQWIHSANWDGGNRYMAYCAPQALVRPSPVGANTGYSAVIPSLDMLNNSTGYASGDLRRQGSVMEHGFHRADWPNESWPGGFTYDTTGMATNNTYTFTQTRSNILKYMVYGEGESLSGGAHSDMPTFILRYADILLIYAEAIMAGTGSTSDGAALAAFNQVHERAGLSPVTSLTIDELLHERKVEFAFEGDYWFDIQRQGKEKASQIIAMVDRGNYSANGLHIPRFEQLPTGWDMFLPVPQQETTINPKLLEDAVDYPFFDN